MEIALQYNDTYSETVFSFANNINTVDGGTHLSGFRSALTRTINAYGQANNLFKDVKENLTGDDVREGPYRRRQRQDSAAAVRRADQGQAQQRHPGRMSRSSSTRSSASSSTRTPPSPRRSSDRRRSTPPAPARPPARPATSRGARERSIPAACPASSPIARKRDPERCELFLVEGESAGGTAKSGRDRKYQAILPLQGKILNVEKARYDKMLGHEEIRAMITALGTGIGKDDFDAAKLRYGKIIIMTDADVDGSHIRTLLLTFFFRHMQELITRGHVFVAQPPLYRIKKGKSEKYIKDDKEFTNEILRRATENIQVEAGTGNGARQTLDAGLLRKFLLSLDELTSLAPKLERRLRDERIVEMLLDTSMALDKKDDLAGERADTPTGLLRLQERLLSEANIKSVISWEEEHSSHRLAYHDSTNAERRIDLDLLQTPEYRRFRVLARDIAAFNIPPFTIARGDVRDEIPDWRTLLESVKKEGMRESSVQRYKGLGEMNAEQLWETTMDSTKRTLLQVRLEDLIECEEIFSTLMGENVESRRKFIEDNALDVKNLDI